MNWLVFQKGDLPPEREKVKLWDLEWSDLLGLRGLTGGNEPRNRARVQFVGTALVLIQKDDSWGRLGGSVG